MPPNATATETYDCPHCGLGRGLDTMRTVAGRPECPLTACTGLNATPEDKRPRCHACGFVLCCVSTPMCPECGKSITP